MNLRGKKQTIVYAKMLKIFCSTDLGIVAFAHSCKPSNNQFFKSNKAGKTMNSNANLKSLVASSRLKVNITHVVLLSIFEIFICLNFG